MTTIAVAMDHRSCGTIDYVDPRNMMKVYCNCGRIIGLDAAQMNLKLSLRKELQCTHCRNSRISRDIEELNALFEVTPEEGI